MRYHFIVLFIVALLTGCSSKEERPGAAVADRAAAAASPGRYLAYEHTIQIDTPEANIAKVFEAGQAACRAAAVEGCTVLASNLSDGRQAFATLKFRAKPAGIRKLVAALSAKGEITEQSTTAEDLEAPITDTNKKLEMLQDYRAKLEALRARASSDVDALIKVNRELAQVQSELEAATGKQAHLMQRVDTEILHVTIRAENSRSFFTPIRHAIADFGTNLSQGISGAIIGLAYLIPWALIIAFTTWIVRKLWRRRKRAQTAT